jgi:hypothetical protein
VSFINAFSGISETIFDCCPQYEYRFFAQSRC